MSVTHKTIALIALTLFVPVRLFGTHNRAGEITYKYISGYTFEFTITTYTYIPSYANREFLSVVWGDGTSQNIALSDRIVLPNNYYFNTYIAQHTFPGTGTYTVFMEDPNRNLGVKNIPNSVNTIFSIQTTLLIGPPLLAQILHHFFLNPPIDNAARNHIFIHNPAAYDPDGDSISYKLTTCTAERGNPIDGYSLPPASDTLYIESVTGDLTWITPIDTGVYNIAMFVDEWRNGVRIGRITRDMQIDVYNTDNNPPENPLISDYCVEAGDTIEIVLTTTDPDNDPVSQYMVGAPIFNNSAEFELIEAAQGYCTSRFTWITNCSQARQQPYTMILKSEDQVNEVSLVDITSFLVRILHNAPENLIAKPGTDSIRLEWDVSNCGIPAGYRIYRKIDPFGFIPDSCENGVPSYTGYVLLDEVKGIYIDSYTDDNHGQGLVPGFDYCYIITTIYDDGAESFASQEVCSTLIPGVPAILHVSVLSDDSQTGEISIKWAVPADFDTIDDGPYRYEIFRQKPNETTYSLIATIPTLDLMDTAYTDQDINTLEFPYFYSVKLLYEDDNGDWIIHPGSEVASSLYLNLIGTDNTISLEILKRAPWQNYEFNIFRRPEAATDFDSIGTSDIPEYVDCGLANLTPYTYRVHSYGIRPLYGLEYNTFNVSHINTTSAIDTSPPCTPIPQVVSICDSSYNILTWTSPMALCGDDDVVNYRIYYKPTLNADFQLIETQKPPDTTFIHNDNLETLAAVYGVAAVDSFENVSNIGIVAIDSCIMFNLPNVFSPNGDGKNDIYISWNMGGFIKKVDMIIFNRYGQPVYKTNDPDISWDGYHKDNGKLVSTGVYYYICEFYEPRLTGEVHRILKGFIHVFSGKEQ